MSREGPLNGSQYEIVVAASFDGDWSSWFEDFQASPEGENTRLSGLVADQAALHGALARLRDLGIPILEIQQTTAPESDHG